MLTIVDGFALMPMTPFRHQKGTLAAVTTALAEAFGAKVEPVSAKIIWKPKVNVSVAGDNADALMKLLDVLDELDDVQNVYDNSELSDEEMARLAG